ncbi:MAG: o-succinylbenzoate synthase [Paludibacteraceae bacterium]|nr:o-succinylbenzoate synthase [Paludibacteraceae bacterium]
MLNASFSKYSLLFKSPSGTSRGVLTEKETYFVRMMDDAKPDEIGVGECAVFRGLSADDVPDYEKVLDDACWNFDVYKDDFRERFKKYPSIVMGLETALADLQNGGRQMPFPSDFTKGKGEIVINGLVWMGDRDFMMKQIEDKLAAGFSCIKMKIGAINFDDELNLLASVRERFSADKVTLRVDANGAFSADEAMEKLGRLASLEIHSIEQPIKAGQTEALAQICKMSPLPIALDEELIGIFERDEKARLLDVVKPQFLVLKPSLHGGFCGSEEWIELAKERGIGWWITSALESNVGLNAIAQWTYKFNVAIPQGLGTGQLFTNNVPSKLSLCGDRLKFDPHKSIWD